MEWDLDGRVLYMDNLPMYLDREYGPAKIWDFKKLEISGTHNVIIQVHRKQTGKIWNDINLCIGFDIKLDAYVVWLAMDEGEEIYDEYEARWKDSYTLIKTELLARFSEEDLPKALEYAELWTKF